MNALLGRKQHHMAVLGRLTASLPASPLHCSGHVVSHPASSPPAASLSFVQLLAHPVPSLPRGEGGEGVR